MAVLNEKPFYPPGDIWNLLETFLVVITWSWKDGVYGTWWVKAWDMAKHPILHRMALTTKNNLTQNVHSAEVKKPCSRVIAFPFKSLDLLALVRFHYI